MKTHVFRVCSSAAYAWLVLFLAQPCGWGQEAGEEQPLHERLAPYFQPPDDLADKLGNYVSPFEILGDRKVQTAEQWAEYREELRAEWHRLLGPWPAINPQPQVEWLDSQELEPGIQLKTIRFEWSPGELTEAYLLVPQGPGPYPAVISVFYEPETAIGRGKPNRDFALQLARRGFVTLSLGTTAASEAQTYAIYYPSIDKAEVQPLSMLAYAATTAWHVLANQPDVDRKRIGIVGHSFGGKWAMFASCLFDGFACAAWSDPGIVFDGARPSINYWEPWYLGYHPPPWRKRGLITEQNPAFGLYPKLISSGWDLHLLHALMAPRPFLVSGGSEDSVERWIPLNHTRAVNRILGFENRVAMSNREDHSPTTESNEIIYDFFQMFLQPSRTDRN